MDKFSRKSFVLASKITVFLGGILTLFFIAIATLVYIDFTRELEYSFEERMKNWNQKLLGDTPVLQVAFKRGRGGKIGPINPRMNFIVFQNQATISRGILDEYPLQRSDFGEIPLNTVVVRTIDNMLFAVYRFQKGEQEVFLYESLSGTIRMLLELGTSGVLLILGFLILIFIVAHYFSRQSFLPLELALRQGEMYNRAIAHELNTPLAVIQTELSLLPKKLQKLPEVLSLQDEIQAMKQTIEALLVLTQGNQEILRELRNIGDLWSQISQEISHKIEYTGIFPILQIHEGLFIVFLRNIARNIARYAQEGEIVRIQISPGILQFSNIPKQHLAPLSQDILFHPFHDAKEGSGLGICLMDRIINLHGWKLEIVSQKELFSVVLHYTER